MRVKLILSAFAIVALATGPAGLAGGTAHASAPAAPQSRQAERAGGVVVKFRAGASLASVASALGDARTDASASTGGSRLVLLQPQPGQTEDDAIASLRARGDVEFAEPNQVVSIAASPTDPLYASNQWNLPQIGLPAAWDTSTGSASVIVAVVDTGVDATHPDLAGKITSGGNAGRNFVASPANSNTADDHFHGTFVSSIIAANTNNGQGGAGVCWSCKIMPVKVLDSTGNGSTFNVAQGVDWAVSHGAQVINLSLGAPMSDSTLQTAVNNAWNAGVVVVAASGNDNGPVLYPGAYANVIAVGSNNQANNRSSFSNFGPELDVMAPGENVLGAICTCNGNAGGWGLGSGTSFASPHVAGVAALLIAAGITDKNDIRTRLLGTATDMDVAGFDNNTGWGRVNAAAAITTVDTTPPTASITNPPGGASVSGTAYPFTATASDAGGIQKVRFWVDATYLGYDSTAPYSTTWNTTLSAPGAHTLKIEALDMANNSTIQTVSVTVVGGDTTPPTASITAPSNGATVSGSAVPFTANASDAGGIQKVRFWVDAVYLGYDSTAPYATTWNTGAFSNGAHTLKIEALDTANNSTIQTISVTISGGDTTPPTASITAPSNGATVSGSAVPFTASASDAGGIQKVRFWVDGTYLGYDSAAPYAATWNSTGFANGAHTLKVQAVDNAGNVSSFVTISVTVSN